VFFRSKALVPALTALVRERWPFPCVLVPSTGCHSEPPRPYLAAPHGSGRTDLMQFLHRVHVHNYHHLGDTTVRGCSSNGRALALHARGTEIDTRRLQLLLFFVSPKSHAYLTFGFALARANARMLINADSNRRSARNRVRTSRQRSATPSASIGFRSG
jgi:hypothetical protein